MSVAGAKVATKGKRHYGFCVFCAAHGDLKDGVFAFWHTAGEMKLLCRDCWERLHWEWAATAGNDNELPFDLYVEERASEVRSLYGRRSRLERVADSDDDERFCARCSEPFVPTMGDERVCDRCWLAENGPPHH